MVGDDVNTKGGSEEVDLFIDSLSKRARTSKF